MFKVVFAFIIILGSIPVFSRPAIQVIADCQGNPELINYTLEITLSDNTGYFATLQGDNDSLAALELRVRKYEDKNSITFIGNKFLLFISKQTHDAVLNAEYTMTNAHGQKLLSKIDNSPLSCTLNEK